MTLLTTATGRVVDLAAPAAHTIHIEDIALHLSVIPRFAGATLGRCLAPYSVAQHSCLVARLIALRHDDPLLILQALLHDAHEAYTGDLTTPLQRALQNTGHGISHVQAQLQAAIHAALGVPEPSIAAAWDIHNADQVALATEWRNMMPSEAPRHFLDPANFSVSPHRNWSKAHDEFLRRFTQLHRAAGLQLPCPVPAISA